MRIVLLIALVMPFLANCAPPRNEVTIGAPSNRPLRTTELANDSEQRIALLAKQLPLTANGVFTTYAPRGRAQWSPGWPRRLDLTGVSWSQKRAGTAITRRHIVLAAHYALRNGSEITFHDRRGAPHKRRIINSISLNREPGPGRSDINVALLDTPLPSSIKTYRLLPPRSDYGHTLPGCPAFVTDQQRRVHIHRIARQSNATISFRKHPELPDEVYKSLITGDSGHPSFLLVGGEPVLIETHTGGGGGSGPFYSSPANFEKLQEAVAKLDPNYQIETVPLDPRLAPGPPVIEKPKIQPTRKASPTSPPAPQGPPRKPRVRRVPVPAN